MPNCAYSASQYRLTSRERLIVQRKLIPRSRSRQMVARPFGFASKQVLEAVSSASPLGFHQLIQKIIHAVIMGRPLRIVRFIAEFMDIALTNQTFGDIECGCYLIKSTHPELFPTKSCLLLMSRDQGDKTDQFMKGPIPEYDLESPALDRYREQDECSCVSDSESCRSSESCVSAGSEEFECGSIPERELEENALDQYHEFDEESCPSSCEDDSEPTAEHHPLSDDLYECQYRLQGMKGATRPGRDEDGHEKDEAVEFGEDLVEQRDSVAAAAKHGAPSKPQGPNLPRDEFTEGEIREAELKGFALDRYREYDGLTPRIITSQDVFTFGTIPEGAPEGIALDRYREHEVPDPTTGATPGMNNFTSGPIPEQDPTGIAVDRYREHEVEIIQPVLPGNECMEFVGHLVEAQESRVDTRREKPRGSDKDACPADAEPAAGPEQPKLIAYRELIGPDDFTKGPITEDEPVGPALDRYRNYRPQGISGPDEFTEGPIPEDEPVGPALDRYRKYDGDVPVYELIEFGQKLVELADSCEECRETKITGVFTTGPIPEHRLVGLALDRYREHDEATSANVGPDAFLDGPIPEGDPHGAALDRYRDVMPPDLMFTIGRIPERDPCGRAVDRYRLFDGVPPSELPSDSSECSDDLSESSDDAHMLPHEGKEFGGRLHEQEEK